MDESESAFPQPTADQLKEFVEGDPIAIDEVITLVLVPLIRWAKKQYSGLPEQEVESLIHQVLGEICVNYNRYDPSQARFTTYVINLFKLRVRDLMSRSKKIGSFEVDLTLPETEHEEQLDSPYNYLEDQEQSILTEDFFERVSEHLDGLEREFLDLLRLGTKDTQAFAEVLGKYTEVTDPFKQVKNTKERLQRKLRSLAQELGYSADDFF